MGQTIEKLSNTLTFQTYNMKKTYLLLSLALMIFFFSAACFLYANTPNFNTSFHYKATSKAITTEVSYPTQKAPRVEKYIDSCLLPVTVFGEEHKINKEVAISVSELKYHIKGKPGSLSMKAYKNENSAASLDKLKNIFEGLKSVVTSN